ncbi:HD domain protein [Vibrio phage BONAISHI]|nr:HD domain protein [Vibrio phage BONAISHI]
MSKLGTLVSVHYTENKRFYDQCDAGHQLSHVALVAAEADRINKELGSPYSTELVVAAAMWHDIFSTKEHRDVHEQKAADYVLEHQQDHVILTSFTKEEIILISNAIRQHRASYKGEYSSKLSEIIAAADRGNPDLDKMLRRVIKIKMDVYSMDYDTAYSEGIIHLKEKFGKNGYAKYPKLYQDMYSSEIQDLQNKLESL